MSRADQIILFGKSMQAGARWFPDGARNYGWSRDVLDESLTRSFKI